MSDNSNSNQKPGSKKHQEPPQCGKDRTDDGYGNDETGNPNEDPEKLIQKVGCG